GDYWYSQGINQLIFHTSAHQPLDTKPGNTMVGIHFHRNITWAEQAKPFIDYLSRTQYLLQEGRFIADIAYYLGEDIPAVVPYWEKLKNEAPEGFNYDFVNTEILNRFEVENGELVLPSGMRYKVLVLPEKSTMTLNVLAKIKELVKNGATIIGPKPVKSPSLSGYPNVDNEVFLQANELWGGTDGQFIYQNNFGKGKVFWNLPLKGILGAMNVEKDIDYTKPHTDTKLSWTHRKTEDSDCYFLLNMRNQMEDLEVQFRIQGKIPELWDATNGTIIPLSYEINDNGITSVQLHLEPQQSVFVVFQKEAKKNELILTEKKEMLLGKLDSSWQVHFPQESGVSNQVMMNKLISWSNHEDDVVKYFSGTAIYTKDFEIKKEWINSNQSIILDLGVVKDIAEVYVNDIKIGTLWNIPYHLDISKVIKKGKNRLEIKVTNQWDNHISGEDKAVKEKSLNDNPIQLKESGLIGPVVLKLK
ncbi:MAG: glycosyl hydrolase, partial [Flavobacterium sp.]